jgi:DNA ligase D-like protein (predicted 3'-phosphoesterase)
VSGGSGGCGDGRRFVIHKHDARTLHYDLRLEVGGVLRSWAVPKGPSTDPREKRLAVAVEDHPLEYGDFEGVIPEGEYGAGTVLIWDAGTYRNISHDDQGEDVPLDDALEKGRAAFWLAGEKLEGGYALLRTKRNEGKDWLLVKMDDEGADARRDPTSTQPASVVSGRTVEEVADEEGPDEREDGEGR